MPSPKRKSSSDNNLLHHHDSSLEQPSRCKESRRQRGGAENDDDNEDERDYEQDEGEEEQQQQEVKEEEQDSEDEDSDGSRSSDDPANLPEMASCETTSTSYIRTMPNMSRNKECPACRTHCASQCSLRDDPRFDALIHFLYDDIEKYEEEELAFHEEEKTRDKQALVTRRKTGKDTESTSGSRLPRKYSRKRRNTRLTEHEGSDDNEDENNHDANKDSSSTDERSTEIKHRRYKRKAGAQSSQPSPSAANSDGGGNEKDLEASRKSKGTYSGPVRSTDMLSWGGGGAQCKSVWNTRIMKLTKYLENAKRNDEIRCPSHAYFFGQTKHGKFEAAVPLLPHAFLLKASKNYVSRETQLQYEDIEIQMKDLSINGLQSTLDP
ncbi:unnamed protein product [Camellia sinensis]